MDGVYRCSKSLQASFAAGISYKEIVDLKVRLDSELRIVADRMGSDSSKRNTLGPYYREYGEALQACDLVIKVIDEKLKNSACEGEPRSFSSNYKEKSSHEQLLEFLAVEEYLQRGLQCYPEYSKQLSALRDESSRLNTGCKNVDDTSCLVNRTDYLLRQADAMLYGSR